MPFFIFDLLSSKNSKFGLTFWLNHHSPQVKTLVIPSTDWCLPPFSRKWKAHGVEVRLRSQFRKKPLKQYGKPWTQYWRVEIHSFFFYYLVIFRHYFTGNGKVSCILATISNWFPNIKIKTKVVSWFSLVIGQNASRQCSIFGRIGDQWVAISSPE